MTLLLSLFSLFALSFFFQAGPPTAAAGMDASAIASVTIPVVALTQISKC